jgi:hypothetical protein
MEGLTETINHVKTELMPRYDFEEYSRNRQQEWDNDGSSPSSDHSGY